MPFSAGKMALVRFQWNFTQYGKSDHFTPRRGGKSRVFSIPPPSHSMHHVYRFKINCVVEAEGKGEQESCLDRCRVCHVRLAKAAPFKSLHFHNRYVLGPVPFWHRSTFLQKDHKELTQELRRQPAGFEARIQTAKHLVAPFRFTCWERGSFRTLV